VKHFDDLRSAKKASSLPTHVHHQEVNSKSVKASYTDYWTRFVGYLIRSCIQYVT